MSLDKLRSTGIPERLIFHLENYDQESLLGFRCQTPFYWETSTLADKPIIPLWECGPDLTYFNLENRSFEYIDLEDPEDVKQFPTLQALLGELFINLYEDNEGHENLAELKILAEEMGFLYFEQLFGDKEAGKTAPYPEWRNRFLHSCV